MEYQIVIAHHVAHARAHNRIAMQCDTAGWDQLAAANRKFRREYMAAARYLKACKPF